MLPHVGDSSLFDGARHICRGCAESSRTLYFAAFRAPLKAREKPTKVVIVATTGKHVIVFNAMMGDGRDGLEKFVQ